MPRGLKNHIVAFDEFAARDGRMAKAQNLCLRHRIDDTECVLEDFLREKGLPELEPCDLETQTCRLVRFLRERRGHEAQSRCLKCTRIGRLARYVVRAFQRGGELAACRLMMDIEHRRGGNVAFEVWIKIVYMHADQEHPYLQYSGKDDGREWRPRLRLVG